MATTLPPPPSELKDNLLYRWLYLAYQAIINLIASSSGAMFGSPGVTTPNKGLVPNSSRSLDYLNLGELAIDGTSVTSTADEINQLHNSNIRQTTLQGLQGFNSGTFYMNSSVSAEAADMISVTINFLDSFGSHIPLPATATIWFSDYPQGTGFTLLAPDTSVLALEGSLYDIDGNKTLFQGITNDQGTMVIEITNTTAATWYLCVRTAFNTIFVTNEITFS